jgi:ubiquinone/menaquinone biosynthesis C-methylase UbiE
VLEVARKEHPKSIFKKGDVHELPFDDNCMDSVQCSRLLWHSKDFKKAVGELVRVLKPGGLGQLKEGDMRFGGLITSDPRMLRILAEKNKMVTSRSAHPHAAAEAYAACIANPEVENVTIKSMCHTYASKEEFDEGLEMETKMILPLVKTGSISEEDME